MFDNRAAAPALSPSALNRQVRTLLESHFDYVWVEGEVSNFACPSSGHWYFSLKDDRAQVRCAMFRNRNQRLRYTPANGDQIRLRARVSLYEGRGEFQLIGEFLEPAGAGALQARFDALRDRLRAEGLFDGARKQSLPRQVSHLAVVTSPTGAALQDILQVLERRNPGIRITVLPAPVQGEE
ncbi:MAG: exodeoxyribonuclease VII large subunit, partial [Pseudomonadota bacterium]